MTEELLRTFDLLSALMPREPSWRVIGSAALWLKGVAIEPAPKDVDVIAPSEVIEGVGRTLGVAFPVAARPDDRFRSQPFFQFQPSGGVMIDFMGDLEVYNGAWHRLRFESYELAQGVYIPTLKAQVTILQQFGRPKDMQRIEAVLRFMDRDRSEP